MANSAFRRNFHLVADMEHAVIFHPVLCFKPFNLHRISIDPQLRFPGRLNFQKRPQGRPADEAQPAAGKVHCGDRSIRQTQQHGMCRKLRGTLDRILVSGTVGRSLKSSGNPAPVNGNTAGIAALSGNPENIFLQSEPGIRSFAGDPAAAAAMSWQAGWNHRHSRRD